MTAVKEQFMQMLPQSLPGVPDDEVQYMINILVKWNKQEEPTSAPRKRKLGIGDGKYKIPDDINAYDDEIAEMFGV